MSFIIGSVAEFEDDNIENLLQECDIHDGTNDIIEKIMLIYLKHNISLVCLEDIMKVFNECREDCNKFPTGKKQIMELFRKHRDLFDIVFFITCDKCRVDTKIDSNNKNAAKCIRCGINLKTTETNFFISIPIENQIIQSVKENWSYISAFDTSDKNGEKSYTDAHDGKILKNLLKEYSDSNVNILSLCLNTDGANKHKSNVLSLWPIQLTQNYLPPNIRFLPNNLIVAGLYYNKTKPNCRQYFLPLINELKSLKERNISIDIENENYIFKPVITHSSFDLPAKSLIQESKQYGGYDGCSFCDIPGELIEIKKSNKTGKSIKKSMNAKNKKTNTKNKRNIDEEEKSNKFVRYVERDEPYNLRDEAKTLETMLAVATSSNKIPVDGIKGMNFFVA